MPILPSSGWDEAISQFPDAHLLQSCNWGELKARFGWEVVRVKDGIQAQILFRKIIPGVTMGYIAKGPVFDGELNVFSEKDGGIWREVDEICRRKRAIFLKVEPDAWSGPDLKPGDPPQYNHANRWSFPEHFCPAGFDLSIHSIQPPRTILVDLRGDEDEILARMKQKTRYNIKLSSKRGVSVHSSKDLELFHNLLKTTGERDRFGVHSLAYYQSCYDLFYPQRACELLLAEYEGRPLAALMVFARGNRAWYFYGASNNEHRELMPAYLLQWEAMRWARQQGCQVYDLWGIPDHDEKTLEEQFENRSDGLWGVYRFKRGFGGKVVRSAGPWDRVYNPIAYQAYRLWLRRTQRDIRP